MEFLNNGLRKEKKTEKRINISSLLEQIQLLYVLPTKENGPTPEEKIKSEL